MHIHICTILILIKCFQWLQLLCSFLFSLQLRNEVFPLQLPGVQPLDTFRLLGDDSGALGLNPYTPSHQRLKQTLLVRGRYRRVDAALHGSLGGSLRPWRHLLSVIVWIICSSLHFGWWTCEPWVIFPPLVGLILKMNCAHFACVHLESSLGLIRVKVAV